MQRGTLLLGLGAAALLGGGLWLGRASSASSATSSTAVQPTAAVRSAAIPVPAADPAPRAPRAPTLPSRGTVATPGLAADLTDSDPKVRRAAIRDAARDSAVDLEVLLTASRDPDLEVGITAMTALGARYADGSIPASEMLARATDRGLHERVRGTAINGLGVIATPEAAALFVDLLARGTTAERATAAILLVHQDPDLAIPALIGALADAEEHVRSNALESLRTRSRGRDFGTNAAAWQAWWRVQPR